MRNAGAKGPVLVRHVIDRHRSSYSVDPKVIYLEVGAAVRERLALEEVEQHERARRQRGVREHERQPLRARARRGGEEQRGGDCGTFVSLAGHCERGILLLAHWVSGVQQQYRAHDVTQRSERRAEEALVEAPAEALARHQVDEPIRRNEDRGWQGASSRLASGDASGGRPPPAPQPPPRRWRRWKSVTAARSFPPGKDTTRASQQSRGESGGWTREDERELREASERLGEALEGLRPARAHRNRDRRDDLRRRPEHLKI